MKVFCLNILKVVAALVLAVMFAMLIVGGVSSLILSALGVSFQLDWMAFVDYLARGVGFGSGLVLIAAVSLALIQWAWPKTPVVVGEVEVGVDNDTSR